MSKNNPEKILEEILHISQNMNRIYHQIIKMTSQAKGFQRYLTHLDLALEYEDKLYKQIPKEEYNKWAFWWMKKYQLTNFPMQQRIQNITKKQLPEYRVLYHLLQLSFYYQEMEIGDLKNILPQETQFVIKESMKHYQLKGMLLNQQLYLIYSNMLLIESSEEDYFHLIYLNKFLENELRHEAFLPIKVENSLDYITKVWSIVPIEEEVRETFNETLLKDIYHYFNTKDTDKVYAMSCFCQLTQKQKMQLLREMELALLSPTTEDVRNKIKEWLNQYMQIIAKNEKEILVRKKLTEI